MRSVVVVALMVIVAAAIAIGDEPLLTERAADQWRQGGHISMIIEQEGVQHDPPSGGVVHLDRAPFTVWIIFTGTPHASLNVSDERGLYDAIGYEWALRDNFADYEMVMGMAEYPHNSDRELIMSEAGVHYLPNPFDEIDHRFNQLFYGGPEPIFMAGGRDVSSIFDQTDWDRSSRYSVYEMPFSSLYLTLFYAEPDDDYVPYVIDYYRVELRFQ